MEKLAVWRLILSPVSSLERLKNLLGIFPVLMPRMIEERGKTYGGNVLVLEAFSLVHGELNKLRFPLEKNCKRITRAMKEFLEFVEDRELVDLQLSEDKYTRRQGDRWESAARLDRFLASMD